MSPFHPAIAKTPSALFRVIDSVQPARYSESLAEGRFTLVELVAHVADMEAVFLDRMRAAHEKPGSPVESVDEVKRAQEKHYSTRDLHHELEVFETRRKETVEFLNSLEDSDWAKEFSHPEWGPVSIAQQFTRMLGHDLYHLEQAAQYLR